MSSPTEASGGGRGGARAFASARRPAGGMCRAAGGGTASKRGALAPAAPMRGAMLLRGGCSGCGGGGSRDKLLRDAVLSDGRPWSNSGPESAGWPESKEGALCQGALGLPARRPCGARKGSASGVRPLSSAHLSPGTGWLASGNAERPCGVSAGAVRRCARIASMPSARFAIRMVGGKEPSRQVWQWTGARFNLGREAERAPLDRRPRETAR